jgi:hypothetical protein
LMSCTRQRDGSPLISISSTRYVCHCGVSITCASRPV